MKGLRRHAVGGELAHTLLSTGGHLDHGRAVCERTPNAVREGLWILFFDNDAVYSIADHFRNTTGIGRDNWQAVRHRFQ